MERVTVIGSDTVAGAALVDYLRDRAFWVRAADAPGHGGHPRANERVEVDLTDRGQAVRALAGVGHVYVLDLAVPRARPSACPPGVLAKELAMLANVLTTATGTQVNRILYATPAHGEPPWRDLPALTEPLLADAQRAGVEIRVGLLANVYGAVPRVNGSVAEPGSAVEQLIRAAAGTPGPGSGVVEVGAGASTGVPWCFAPDCAVALYLLMRSNHRRPLLLAHPRRHALAEVAAVLSRLTLRPVVTAEAGAPAAFEPPAGTADDLRRALAWTPPTDLPAGLATLFDAKLSETPGGAR
jgi:nucleoside-diphosphate-sugar epimerase